MTCARSRPVWIDAHGTVIVPHVVVSVLPLVATKMPADSLTGKDAHDASASASATSEDASLAASVGASNVASLASSADASLSPNSPSPSTSAQPQITKR